MDNNAMYQLSYGLYVLTAKDGDKDNGCIINTAMQVTSDPNQILIVVNKQNYTHDIIKKTGLFNVCVLSQEAPFETFKNWGYQSGREHDKVVGITYKRAENGVIYLTNNTTAYISGTVISSMDVGTHTMFLALVTDASTLSEEEAITYTFYQNNVKPAPVKQEGKKGYICTICGYVYENDVLPDDFICPICKHGVADFKKL
ncbi:MAG: flavin reductase [Velocimicrobium sp.]